VKKLVDEKCDFVTGTRMVLGDALTGGMPIWKFIPNRFLTWLENFVFQTRISDYHNGFRAYSASFLRQVPLDLLSEKFDFDTDMVIDDTHCYNGYLVGFINEIRTYANGLNKPITIELVDFDVDVDTCVERNKSRDAKVEKAAIYHMAKEKKEINISELDINLHTIIK
jgi:hypothetical protein